MHFSSCYFQQHPQPELLDYTADSKVSSVYRLLGIAIKSDGVNIDDVCDCESNVMRIVLVF